MFLLKRVAISNGNKVRKEAANKLLAVMDSREVANWHQSLQVEIRQKEEKRYSLAQSHNTLLR